MVFDCLQLITSSATEKLASSLTGCGSMENVLCSTLGRPVDVECVYFCLCHLLVISGIQNILLVSNALEW